MSKQHWHLWVWACRWCGDPIPEFDLYYQKKKRKEFCSCWCLRDMKNFLERVYGKNKLKSISNPKNDAVSDFVEIALFMMIERKPMKPIAEHLKLLKNAKEVVLRPELLQVIEN